jgi:hypothetical protein
MFPILCLLLCSAIVNAQIEFPVAPPEVLQDRASDLALALDSTACDNAVRFTIPILCVYPLYLRLTVPLAVRGHCLTSSQFSVSCKDRRFSRLGCQAVRSYASMSR